MRIRAAALALGLFICVGEASAQPPGQGARPGQRREMLEQRLRERTGEVVKRGLQLSDEQMVRLQTTSRQFEQQRSELLMREREARRELRQQVMAGEKADQSRVAQLIDQTLQLERQRLDLLQNEQRELAKFLTPVQRAKLLGLQNELRMRAQELRRGQMRRPAPRGGGIQ